MRLQDEGLKNTEEWKKKGYALPLFDREKMRRATKDAPFWIHFGAGNIFRAFQANVVQNLLNAGILERGLIVAEGFDYEIIERLNRPHDDLSILVTLKANGGIEKTVVGSVAESCVLDSENLVSYERLKEIFRADSLQIASFTITEKGYRLTDGKGAVLPDAAADFASGPEHPKSYMGKVASLLYARYLAGASPIAMVSMDNCSHNGDKLRAAILSFAGEWEKSGKADRGFMTYLSSAEKVSFPWTMIDKITPRPDAAIQKLLEKDGIEQPEIVVTAKNTYAAPFVNAEECEYLIVEDAFPNGRPALEKGGIQFTTRETVEKAEKMKVCTCLNPLHTALAVFGCLLGYRKISDEMNDPQLKKLAEAIGYREGLPVVTDPGILNPKEFLDTVLTVRIPNPFMPDTPQRIATDTSQKLAIRFGETIRSYAAAPDRTPADLVMIPLVFAGWLRYLMAVDDEGIAFPLSPDPLLKTLRPYVRGVRLGEPFDAEKNFAPLLRDKSIWGADLYEAGLAQKVCAYFEELTAGVHAVRQTLERALLS